MTRFILSAAAAIALVCSGQTPSSPAGDWAGALQLGPQQLRLVFHIQSADGKLSATLDSPDQGARGIPTSGVTQQGATIKIDLAALRAGFEGKLSENGQEIQGSFRQAGMEFPLTLKRLTAAEIEAAKPKRPQIPVKPYPYEERDLTVANKAAAGVTLACTLTVPRGQGPFPGVVALTGSGPQTRDEEVAGHPVFLVVADQMTRKGIAVLRCDDRGIGKSTGDFRTATTADFATDAEAAFDALRFQAGVDAKRCGLLGHSEGGVIAPLVASRRSDVAFVVMLAGTGVPGRKVILSQKEAILKASGVSDVDLSADNAAYDAVIAGKDQAAILEAGKGMFAPGTPEEVMKGQIRQISSPWFRYFLTYDPAAALSKVKQPVLALFGEKDLQVLPALNEPPIRAALKLNKAARIETVPGVNHLFQPATTGSPAEYSKTDETVSPKVLNLVADWILGIK